MNREQIHRSRKRGPKSQASRPGLAGLWLGGLTLIVAASGARAGTGGFQIAEDLPQSLAWIRVEPELAPQAETPAEAGGALRTPESFYTRYPAIRTGAEVLAANAIMTLGGRIIFEPPKNDGFKVGIKSIHENLKAGWTWDDNTFSANNFRHPYQGALYFNAARDNGYGFFASSMWSWAGAWLFEYSGETHLPSANDWVNTAVGGIILGEALKRLSDMVLDNTATGSGRAWRELGGFLVNPARGVNRLVSGAATTVHANPIGSSPERMGGDFRVGLRTLGEDRLWDGPSSKVFVNFGFEYGDAFAKREEPFDHFTFGAQLNLRNTPHGIGRLTARGFLGATEVSRSEGSQHLIASYLHFDYIDNEAYTYGGSSIAASLLSKMWTRAGFQGRTWLDVNGILLGATKSDYANISGREYDYGPGLGFKFAAGFGRGGREYVQIGHESFFVHVVSGNDVTSYVTVSWLRSTIPLRGPTGLGIDYVLYNSSRDYKDLPRVDARNPELRLSLVWQLY